jgi:hypothetical protein
MRQAAVLVAAAIALVTIGSPLDARGRHQGGRARAGALPTASATPTGTGAISGVVVDATTGRPVAGAIVSLGLTSGGPVILTLPRTVTDAKGRFLFGNLAPSTRYYLRATRTGYAFSRYGAAAPLAPTLLSEMSIRTIDNIATIAVAADQWVSDVTVQLWRLGSVSGRVRDERGEPLVGVAVRAFSTAMVAGHTYYVASDPTTTDDRGEYRLGGLLPGKYAVSVLSVQSTVLSSTPEGAQRRAVGELSQNPSGGSSAGLPAIDIDGTHRLALSAYATPPPPSAGASRAYAAAFYPDASTLAAAELIDVGYGTVRRGVDFQLRPVMAVNVSGRVDRRAVPEPASGGASPPMLLRLMPAGSERLGVGSEAATTVVERDGSFTFLNVPAGDYTLLTQSSASGLSTGGGETSMPPPPGSPSTGGSFGWLSIPGVSYTDHGGTSATPWGRTSVSVGATDVSGVVLPLHRTSSVRARIVFADGVLPQLRYSTLLAARPANGDPALGSPGGFVTIPDKELYTIDGLMAGTYLIGFSPVGRGGIGIVSIVSDGRDVRDTGLEVAAGRDVDDLVITLTTKIIGLTGTVRGATSPVAAAVIAFPVDRARWINFGPEPERIQSRSADSAGAFDISGLPEGDYFVVAVDPSQHDAWTDPKFLEAASAVATRVSLKWGDKKTLDLAISKVPGK